VETTLFPTAVIKPISYKDFWNSCPGCNVEHHSRHAHSALSAFVPAWLNGCFTRNPRAHRNHIYAVGKA
jgi:hypothetical protein